MLLETASSAMLAIQFFHSIEELSTGFYEKSPFKIGFRPFFLFEILFFGFWTSVLLWNGFPARAFLLAFFVLLEFANGMWHLVWWGVERKYVPGLFTAPLFVLVFVLFYFTSL